MRRGWQLATLGLIAFAGLALVIGWFGATFINARPLPYNDTLGPGPGFFPFWLSIIALLLGVALLVEVGRRPAEDDASPYPQGGSQTKLRLCIIMPLLLIAAWKFPSLPLLEKLGVSSETLRAVIASVIAAGTGLALAILPNQHEELSGDGAVLRIASVIGLLALAAGTLDPLGFRITAFLFTALLLPALGSFNLKVVVPFVLIASLGVFYVFYHALKVPLPIGPYDWIFKPVEIAGVWLWSIVSAALSFAFR